MLFGTFKICHAIVDSVNASGHIHRLGNGLLQAQALVLQDTPPASQPPGDSPFSDSSLQGGVGVSEDAPGSPSKRAAALDLTGAEISQQTGAYTS